MQRKQLSILALLTLFHSGVYAQGDLTLTPQTLNFGDVYIWEEKVLNITVENVGDQPVNFGAPPLGDYFRFGDGDCFDLMLNPGDSCTHAIVFEPTITGSVSLEVELVSNAPDSPDIFTLTGNALSPFGIGVRDQGRIFGTGGVVAVTPDALAQSITTGITGQLLGIQIQYNGEDLLSAPPMIFSIVEGGNPPVGNLLYEELLDFGAIDDSQLITWDLTGADLFFDVGDQFTFVLRTATDSILDYIAGNDPPGYVGGELYLNGVALPGDEVNDIAFITFVDPDGAPSEMAPKTIPTLGFWGLVVTISSLLLLGAFHSRTREY